MSVLGGCGEACWLFEFRELVLGARCPIDSLDLLFTVTDRALLSCFHRHCQMFQS